MEVARRVARNAIYNISGLIVGNVSGLFLTVVLARILKPENFGIYSLALSIAMLSIALANLGVDNAVVRYVAYYAGKEDYAKIRGHFRYFLRVKLLLSTLVSSSLIVLSRQLAMIFGDERLVLPFVFAGLVVFFASLANFLNAFFMGLQEFKYSFLKQVVYEASRWIFVVPLGILYLASGAILGFSLAYAMSSLFLLFILIGKYANYVRGLAEAADRKVNAFISFMTVASISGIIYAYVDSVMIGYLLTPTDVGYYRAAYVIVFAIVGLISSFSYVLFPTFTQLSVEDINRSLERLLRYTSIVAFPSAFAISYLSDKIIKLIYGIDYLPAIAPMMILAFALIPDAFAYLGTIFSAKERPEINASVVTASMILNVILNYILITSIGMVGAAIATVISRFFVISVNVILLYRLFRIVPNVTAIVKPMLASLIMVVVLMTFSGSSVLAKDLISVILAGSVYILILFILRGITLEDINYLRAIIK